MKLRTRSIHAVLGFTKLTPADLLQTATAIYTGTSGNPAFSNPPVDMAELKADIDNFAAAITAALDGGTKAINERNRLAEVLIKSLERLGKHVEIASKDDMTTFLSSGYQPKAAGRGASSSLTESIRSIDPGPKSGQMQIKLAALPDALSYEIRWGEIGTGGALPTNWSSQPAGKTRPPAVISSLTPAGTYAIQVRAVLRSGYTDWSDPVIRICN